MKGERGGGREGERGRQEVRGARSEERVRSEDNRCKRLAEMLECNAFQTVHVESSGLPLLSSRQWP